MESLLKGNPAAGLMSGVFGLFLLLFAQADEHYAFVAMARIRPKSDLYENSSVLAVPSEGPALGLLWGEADFDLVLRSQLHGWFLRQLSSGCSRAEG